MKHPLQSLEIKSWTWWLLGSSFVLLSIVMLLIPIEPNILAFEFNALNVVSKWDETGKIWAAFSLGLDFLYIPIYSTLLALGCVSVRKRYSTPLLANSGIALAWGQWLAAVFDGLENLSLLVVLFGALGNIASLAAMLFAIAKFALIISGLIYIMAGLIFRRR